MPLYGLIFPDINTKTRIQTAERLRSPTVRKVVDEMLECIDAFRKKYPDLAGKYLKPAL
jgi:hypothetical protein